MIIKKWRNIAYNLKPRMGDTARNITDIILKRVPHFENITLTPDVHRVLNNKKVTDHTAIILTLELDNVDLDTVPEGGRKIHFLIANRMLCAMSEPYIYETVTGTINCNGYSYTAKGRYSVRIS